MKSFNETVDDHLLILHLIATGVLQLADSNGDGQPLRFPYPAPLQRGLDRLTVYCRRVGAPPPASAMDLLNWCRQPLGMWPLSIVPSVGDSSDCLLDGPRPTRICEEWSVDGADVEAEVHERRLLHDVLDTCRAANAPKTYVAFRRLLIERPVLTAIDLHRVRSDDTLGLLADHVQHAYLPAPAEAATNGRFTCCYECGNLLLPDASGRPTCANSRCRRDDGDHPGQVLDRRDGVLWLRRALRTFIAAPGRVELRLATRLETLGATVELWPHFDAYDLRVVFPGGEVWAIDVKDWANPFLLARQVQRIPETPAWSHAYFVFAQERLRRADYLRAFISHCAVLGGAPPVGALMEGQLIARARRLLKRGKSNA